MYLSSDLFLGRSNSIIALLVNRSGVIVEYNNCAKGFWGDTAFPADLSGLFSSQECKILMEQLERLFNERPLNINTGKVTRVDWVEWQLINQNAEKYGLLTLPKDRFTCINNQARQEIELFHSLTQTIPAFLFRFSLNTLGEMSFLYFARGRQTHFLLNENRVGRAEGFIQENVHPDDIPDFFKSIIESAKTLTTWKQTVRIKSIDNTYRWAEGMANPELQANGDVEWSGVMFDIHELMNTRQMLEEMATAGDIGYWEFYPATNELYWTEQTRRIHEVPDNFLPDVNNALEFYKPGVSRETINKAFFEALNEGKPFDVECEIITYKGKHIWVRAKGKVELNEGDTVKMSGIFQNITKEMHNRETIRYNQWLYQSSFLNSPAALIQTNDAGEVINVNGLAMSMFGYSNKEFLKQTRYTLFSNEENKLTEYIEQRRLTGEKKAVLIGIKKDGTKFPVEVLSVMFQDIDGNILINKALLDLSDQFRIEQIIKEKSVALDRIFNESIDAICSCDTNGVFLSMSRSSIKNWGYRPEEMIGRPFMDFVIPEDHQSTRDIFARIRAGYEVRSFKNRYIHKNGSIVINEWSAKYDALTGHVYAIGRDVTEFHKVQSEKELLMRELISSNQDLRQFTYITSHNLRAPIANLIGLLELLKMTEHTPEELQDIYQGLSKTGEQINKTISDLNEILVIRDKTNIDKEWIEIPEILEKVKKQVSIALKKAEVSWNYDFSQFSQIWFNRTYLESILLNLVTNALKYRSPNRPLEIYISISQKEGKSLLTFRDNGQGLDTRRYADRLFGLYQRFHINDDSKGLGLYLVKTQIEALGGSIEAEGKEDEGLTFRLSFVGVPPKKADS